MTTITGLTAARMLQIEAASIVDGDVVGDDLILTRHDGTTIDAGSVRGAPGPVGPAGLSLADILSTQVLDVGAVGQIRAGRKLTLADFSVLCGLPSTPVGLFNLSDLTNLGSGGALSNRGAVGFAPGILGAPAEAAQFSGAISQALYISDAGAGDPFRLSSGSWGCWFTTTKRGVRQTLLAKAASGGTNPDTSWSLRIGNSNAVEAAAVDVAGNAVFSMGATDVCDNQWHFAVATHNGSILRLYVDGVMEASFQTAGPIQIASQMFNIGGRGANAVAVAVDPHFGRIDEAFVTPDVLSEEQVRLLYCTAIPHGYGSVPKMVILNINRRRKGVLLVSGDFPSQPARLYNLSDLNDLGSNNVPLVANQGSGSITQIAGPDGSKGTARSYSGTHSGDSGTDAGLPSGTDSRSYGAWFKTTAAPASGQVIMGFGTNNSDARIYTQNNNIAQNNVGDVITGPIGVNDGKWHQVIMVEDNTAVDGLKRKMYLDGKLVGSSTVLNSITLVGANGFRIGGSGGTLPFTGQIARAFVYAGVLSPAQVRTLYAKGGQDLGASPKNPGDHIETFDSANVYATFDTIESQNLVNLAVAA